MARPLAGLTLAVIVALWPVGARAFDLDGHEVIEAAAYRRLLAMEVVPGAGPLPVSGRALLASLIATGVLEQPPCFDPAHAREDCRATRRLALPLLYWPVLRSGAPDLVIDRQIGQKGQCQHFMARTNDGLSPPDPRFGVPRDLITTAYGRCVEVAGEAFDGILRDPHLAHWRLVGTYALMHAIEDSFSPAHVHRDQSGRVVHLLSWTLIDWPRYLVRGVFRFPKATHHAIIDPRDAWYLRRDARAHDGSPCESFHNAFAVPDECLTDRASTAADAVVDYLILTYRLRATAIAEGRLATIFDPSQPAGPLWLDFVRTHAPSVAADPRLPSSPVQALSRPDLFLGAQGTFGEDTWGAGAWGSHLVVGPALPFVLHETLAAGFVRASGQDLLTASAGMGLLLPLVRRFAIGMTPVGFRLACQTDLDACTGDVTATLGDLLMPIGEHAWLDLVGPRWSWRTRTVGDTWFGVALGWSHEDVPRPEPPGSAAVAAWNPPRPEEVTAYRHSRSTWTTYVTATAGSTVDRQFIGVGLEWLLDRDRWDRRAGLAPGLLLEVDAGDFEGWPRNGGLAVAPTLRAYALPGRLALTATPALLRMGTIAQRSFAFDVAARAGLVLILGRVEIGADSPPLSYVATSRWHALPFTARLGLWFD